METTCKLGSRGCWNDGKCRATSNCENKVVTNADRIRAMSDEELERFIRNIAIHFEPWCDNHCKMDGDEDCNQCLANWLQQPAENPVKWSKPGPCPVTPEQFDAIYNDEEEPT